MSEREQEKRQLTEEELERIQCGTNYYVDGTNNRFYQYIGDDEKDRDRKYVCPICGTRLHYGKAWRYYCDPCNKSWFLERYLQANLNSGVWKEIDSRDFYSDYYA